MRGNKFQVKNTFYSNLGILTFSSNYPEVHPRFYFDSLSLFEELLGD